MQIAIALKPAATSRVGLRAASTTCRRQDRDRRKAWFGQHLQNVPDSRLRVSLHRQRLPEQSVREPLDRPGTGSL